jgi:hypothetical protein
LDEGGVMMLQKSAQMNIPKMEKQVMSNSILLEKKLTSLMKDNSGKYVVFHKGEYYIADSLTNGLKIGIDTFGEETGFVLKQLLNSTPLLSLLVKL